MPPLIATPISHLFENEKYRNEIISVSDCLELRQNNLDAKWGSQLLFHTDIDITLKWNETIKNRLLSVYKKKHQLKLITFHITRCCQGERVYKGVFQLEGRVYNEQELLDNAAKNIQWLRTILHKRIKIGVENNNYYPTQAYNIVTSGDFISKVIDQNRVYLLLDIAHAMVTAHNTQVLYQDYIATLPLDKTIQLHICQPYLPDGEIAQDIHELPNESMLNEVVRLISLFKNIQYLTVEYYKNKDMLINSIISLIKHINAIEITNE